MIFAAIDLTRPVGTRQEVVNYCVAMSHQAMFTGDYQQANSGRTELAFGRALDFSDYPNQYPQLIKLCEVTRLPHSMKPTYIERICVKDTSSVYGSGFLHPVTVKYIDDDYNPQWLHSEGVSSIANRYLDFTVELPNHYFLNSICDDGNLPVNLDTSQMRQNLLDLSDYTLEICDNLTDGGGNSVQYTPHPLTPESIHRDVYMFASDIARYGQEYWSIEQVDRLYMRHLSPQAVPQPRDVLSTMMQKKAFRLEDIAASRCNPPIDVSVPEPLYLPLGAMSLLPSLKLIHLIENRIMLTDFEVTLVMPTNDILFNHLIDRYGRDSHNIQLLTHDFWHIGTEVLALCYPDMIPAITSIIVKKTFREECLITVMSGTKAIAAVYLDIAISALGSIGLGVNYT